MDTKWCNRCQQTLSKTLFTESKSRYDGLQAYCQECMKAYRIEHYQKNKVQYYDRNKKKQAELRDYVLSIKKSPCSDCGASYPDEPWLMEFDHLVPEDKWGEISKAVKWGSLERLKKEIAKCELVCALCHRRRTALRGGWLPNSDWILN